jgi:hypothetical protein
MPRKGQQAFLLEKLREEGTGNAVAAQILLKLTNIVEVSPRSHPTMHLVSESFVIAVWRRGFERFGVEIHCLH